jgi:hypothetical protein
MQLEKLRMLSCTWLYLGNRCLPILNLHLTNIWEGKNYKYPLIYYYTIIFYAWVPLNLKLVLS